jgi:hypothetical protein
MPYYRGKPVERIDELLELYATEDKSQIPVFNILEDAKNLLAELYEKPYSEGFVISIEGGWGTGKTSFLNLLGHELSDDLNISVVSFDSLYYGNPSEATSILIESIFTKLKNDFGVRVKEGLEIAQNITPDLELTNGLPKLTLRYNRERKSTESILHDGVRRKLKDINGRLIIVIDDIDRLPPEDAVHFLRIVRVLKELPNVIILLPIDRGNLENLITTQKIAKPKAYLQKIIDKSYSINPDQGNARILFERLMHKKYPNESRLSAEVIELLWHLLLWEISLRVIREFERDGTSKFRMAAAASDPNNWGLLEPLSLPNGDNLVRKFIEQTSFDYGGTNYLVHVNDHASQVPNQRTIYRHYKLICSDASFTEFIYGTYIKNLNPQVEDVNFGPTMMDFEWWMEKDIQAIQPNQGQAPEYTFAIPQDEMSRNTLFTNIGNVRRYMWDDIAGLASQFLPPQALQYLSARTINRIIDNLRIDYDLVQGTERAEIQRQVRKTVENEVDFTKDV